MSTYQQPGRYGRPPVYPNFGPGTDVKRRSTWKRLLIVVLVVGLLVGGLRLWQWSHDVMPGYVGDGATVAQVSMTKTQLSPQIVDIHLILFDANHHPFEDFDCYTTKGNNLVFYGDVLIYKLNIPGLYSGYKVTRIDGCYQKPTYTANDNNTLFISDNAQDSFFTFVQQSKNWLAWLVEAHSARPFSLRADTKTATYNLLASPQSPQGLSIGK